MGPSAARPRASRRSFNLTDALNIFAFRPDLNLGAVVRALQQQGLLQILAEPNLVTSNGKEASFLVGGEFPIPVLQGGANAGAITIQFREFGIRLTFNPQMTEHGTLKMSVKPEVSTIDLANSVTVSGFTIPALATRRIESTIELGPGQSFVIGGLIDDRANETMARIPGCRVSPSSANCSRAAPSTAPRPNCW
jgi:pilus assembly protein CpaC